MARRFDKRCWSAWLVSCSLVAGCSDLTEGRPVEGMPAGTAPAGTAPAGAGEDLVENASQDARPTSPPIRRVSDPLPVSARRPAIATVQVFREAAAGVVLSPDGSHLAAHGQDSAVAVGLRVYKVGQARPVRELRVGATSGIGNVHRLIGFDATGGSLFFTEQFGDIIRLDVATGETSKVPRLKSHSQCFSNPRLFHDHNAILAHGIDSVAGFRAGSEQPDFTIHIDQFEPADAAMFPSRQRLAVAGTFKSQQSREHPGSSSTVQVWKIDSRELVVNVTLGFSAGDVDVSADGRLLGVTSRPGSPSRSHQPVVLDAETGSQIRQLDARANAIQFLQAPDVLAVQAGPRRDDNLLIVNARTGQTLAEFEGLGGAVGAFDLSADGKTLAAVGSYITGAGGTHGAKVKLYDVSQWSGSPD